MAIQVSLRGIDIPYEKSMTIPHAGTRAYARARLLEEVPMQQVQGTEIVGVLYAHEEDIEGILRAVQTHPYEIDAEKQIEDLGLLIDATQRIECVVRAFLSSSLGRFQWNGGVIFFCSTTINIADQCTKLTLLAARMHLAKQPVRRQIEVQSQVAEKHAASIFPFLDYVFPKEIILIISRYI